jgi:hypothetical protein
LVRWVLALAWAIPPAGLWLVAALLALPLLLRNYSTAMPLETYQAMMYAGLGMSAVFLLVALGGATALITSCFPESVQVFRLSWRRAAGADAALALAAAAALTAALGRIHGVLEALFPAQALFSIDAPVLLASAAPAVSAVADAFREVVMGAAVLGIAALAIRKVSRAWMLVPLALAALFILISPDVHTPAELGLEAGMAALRLACAWLLCWWIARGNLLAYALILWYFALRMPIATLLAAGNAALRAQGWLVAAVLALSLLWALYPAFRERVETAGPATA